jgi:carboxypeptidase C (cathepsin A)
MSARFRPAICAVLCTFFMAAAEPAPKQEEPQDKQVQTTHSITLNGEKLDYQATAGTLVLRGEDNKPTASVFFVAYTKAGVTDAASRPVTFAFNGGPGSSAVWLHMGCLGPRRIDVGDVTGNPAPPYKVIDNEYTMLDRTDLVFIDPISTGFSRAAPGVEAKKFHGVQGDTHSVGGFIRNYLTKYRRWNSPKFLIGESYGTTRSSLLGEYLQGDLGIYLNGITLVSPALNFQTIIFSPGNDLPYVLFLPGYTATAWYHKKLEASLQQQGLEKVVSLSREFAQNDYTRALFKGTSLSADEQKQIASRLGQLTALEPDWILRKNLRVDAAAFFERLLIKDRLIVGRFDSRFTMPHGEEPVNVLQSDPSWAAVLGPFTASFNAYIRGELKYESDLPYELLNLRLNWDWTPAQNTFLNVSDSLRQALLSNRDLRVFLATGYYDLATPILSTEWTINHLGLEPDMTKRLGLGYYEGGHMMYLHIPSLKKLKQDLDSFVDTSLKR